MNKIFSYLLKEYDHHDTEIYLKAKFILITTLFVIFAVTMALLYTTYLAGIDNAIIFTEFFFLITLFFTLILLVKGKYSIAIHIILISGFATVWGVLFIEPNISMFAKMDTIVFVVGLLAAMPLMFFESKKPMVLYYIVNLLLFFLFNFHLYKTADLMISERLDYFFDNLIVITFVFLISFNLFSIYKQALASLKEELKTRKKAEKELRESEKKYRYLFDHAPVGMYEIDFVNNKFRDINDTFVKHSGYTRKELLSMNPFDLLTEESKKHLYERYEKLTSGEKIPSEFEYEIVGKNGQKLSVILNNDYIYENNKVKGARVVAHNTTERKKMENIIMQSEKMMSVGGLAAGMAHEINNPLAGMIQNANVLSNRLTNIKLPANQKAADVANISMQAINDYMESRDIPKMLKGINESGLRIASIVENMLSFARKSDLTFSSHNPVKLIDKALELAATDFDIKKHYDFKTISIEKIYEDDLPLIACDANQIQQVLLNILKNGAHEMLKNSSIPKPKFTLKLQYDSDLKMLKIEIQDNGRGMDKETCKRVFEPFFTTKPVGVGTGLGLSVSYFIITENHGGMLSVLSELKKGTAFIICLPIKQKVQE